MSEQAHTVYLLCDENERPLYVGVTTQGMVRLAAHLTKEWWPRVSYAHFEHIDGRRPALDRERFLIEQLEPEFNTVHKIPQMGRKKLVPPAEEEAA